MTKLKSYWQEVDADHVKHVTEVLYAKTELLAQMQYLLRGPASSASNMIEQQDQDVVINATPKKETSNEQ